MAEVLVPWEGDKAGELLLQVLTRISWSLDGDSDCAFTYVIGNNGTGKSHLLAALADQVAYSEATANVACISNSLYDRFNQKGPDRYKYLGARSVSNAIFKTSLDRQLFEQILVALRKDPDRLKLLMDAVGLEFEFTVARYSLTASKEAGRTDASGDRVAPLSVKHTKIVPKFLGQRRGFDALNVDQIDALIELVRFKPTVSINVRERRGDWLKFMHLSSGEQNRVLLLAKVVASIDANTVLLIDEPEVSLHLHWQMAFHRSLNRLLQGFKKTHVVVATHSPILISEAAKEDPDSEFNAVVIVEGIAPMGTLSAETSVSMVPIHYAMHSFAEVASHDQLVLRYFRTAPYQGREVSIEVADALLAVAEGGPSDAAVKVLDALRSAEGLESKDLKHIQEAIRLIERGIVSSVARELAPPEAEPAGAQNVQEGV